MYAKALKIVGVNLLVFAGLLLLLELAAQIVAAVRPSYDVLYMHPDRAVGWKPVPNLRFTWAGWDWYAAEFSVDVNINASGFRDLPRAYAKPPGVKRVAVLGDSFIEAVQVPLDQAATGLLERRLNAEPVGDPARLDGWEVLNFGVSNHGIGQYLLMWEEYARRFQPDYVAVFVAKFHMRRTVSKYEYRAFAATKSERLWVRPTFRIENGALIREPARDFDEFVQTQETVDRIEFDGKRIRRKPPQLITLHYAHLIWDELKNLAKRAMGRAVDRPRIAPGSEDELVALNLRILDELGASVSDAGGKLIVVDASQYFEDDPGVARQLNELCAARGFGYVPVYAELRKANADGIATRWLNDTHFNEAGNRILAASLYAWIAQDARAGKAP